MLIDLKWDAAEVTVVIMAGVPTFLSVECKWAAKLKELKVYPTVLITVQSVFFSLILWTFLVCTNGNISGMALLQ